MTKTITSTQNPYIKELKLLKRKKGRADGRFLCEGEKCALEAMLCGDVEAVLLCGDHPEANKTAGKKGIDLYEVSDAVMEALSDTKSQQGVIAVARKQRRPVPSPRGLFVMLEDVADPQNVGTIIRTADAAGAACVMLSKRCADYTSPKAVRASMGSVFHLPIVVSEDICADAAMLKQKGMRIFGTHLKGEGKLAPTGSDCVVIGSEANGMSEKMAALCDGLYKIPMRGSAERLNAAVAAGIVIYMMSGLI